MNPEDTFEKAVWDLLEGHLSEEEFKELESALMQSEEGRERFLEIADLHGLLYQKLGQNASDPSVVSMDEVIQRQQRRILKRSALAAAALLLLAGLVMSVIWLKHSAPLVTFQHTEDSMFHVSHAKKSRGHDPDELAIGSRLLLSQGTVELTLKSGVQAIVRAPADLTIQEKDQIIQKEGVIHYVVPPSAVGFQVLTPDILVTDLGTEFGVVSSPHELDHVHLFKGKLEIESRRRLKTKEILTGIESRIIGSIGHFNAIDSSPQLFKTSLREKLPYLHLSFDHLEEEQLEVNGNLPGLEQVSATLKKRNGTPNLAPGPFGNAIELNGHGGFVQTNWEGISGSAPRSVAFWCKLPVNRGARIPHGLVAWGDLRTLVHKFVIITNRDSDAGQKGAIRFDCGRGYATGETELTDGEWHHVAVVMAGEIEPGSGMQIQLFVDGEREELTGFLANNPETTPGTDEKSWMTIGRYRLPGMANHNCLTGSLDELYVFLGILTQSDVRQIMNGDWSTTLP
ncbi:MAG: LamG-like jellyroll fold domain-containing protein [Roseibacillus sp.]